jgi:mono/diheme cytochrome c family protein
MQRVLLALIASLTFGVPAHAADYASMSGKDLYKRFCAACHGIKGEGDGPVAGSLNVEVPDLTLIARRAGGVFPRERILRIIDGRHIFAAHGTRTMPVWGEDLSRLNLGDPNAEREAQIVMSRLADYLWQLQRPAPK